MALSLAWLTLYATLLGRIAAVPRRPAVQRWQERVLGIVFIGFGARLIAERV